MINAILPEYPNSRVQKTATDYITLSARYFEEAGGSSGLRSCPPVQVRDMRCGDALASTPRLTERRDAGLRTLELVVYLRGRG